MCFVAQTRRHTTINGAYVEPLHYFCDMRIMCMQVALLPQAWREHAYHAVLYY